MKLYAKTKSERAEKGQGGNEYLDVQIKGEQKTVIFEFRVQVLENCYKIEGYSTDETSTDSRRSDRYFIFEPTKGKK